MAGETCLSGSLAPDENSIMHALCMPNRRVGIMGVWRSSGMPEQASALPNRKILHDLHITYHMTVGSLFPFKDQIPLMINIYKYSCQCQSTNIGETQ